MMRILCRLARDTAATAAVETAIFLPIFLLFTLGITDLGAGMYRRTQVNATVQGGASFGITNINSTMPICVPPTMSTDCLNAIKDVMNNAFGIVDQTVLFCSGSVCSAEFIQSTDPRCPATGGGSATCLTVSANLPYVPILPVATYAWATSMTISSIATFRIQ